VPCDPGDGNLQLSEKVVVAQGTQDDTPWQIEAYDSNGGLCVDLRVVGVAAGGCGHEADTVGVSSFVGAGQWVAGQAQPEVASVSVTLADGRALEAQPMGIDGGFNVGFYALRLPEGSRATTVAFLDANGTTLTTKPVPTMPE
jgi:hypothetical protein